MQIEKNIAATLQRKMNAAGKTKLEFSKELGIPRSTFQEYLKGDKCLRSDSIEELAKSLSISPAQLISGPEYADARGLFSADALLAELQTLHPRAQELAKEAVSLLQTAFRISAEWDKLDNGSALITGVIVARRDVVEANPGAVDSFLQNYAASVEGVNGNTAEAAALVGEYGIVDAAVAEKALPYCNIVCLTGGEMKDKLSGYLKVLSEAEPSSVGGTLPGDDFYYEK